MNQSYIDALTIEHRALSQKVKEIKEAIETASIGLAAREMADQGINVGDAVNVISSRGLPEKGILHRFEYKYGKAEPVIKKIKKDGATSKVSLYSHTATITKADT